MAYFMRLCVHLSICKGSKAKLEPCICELVQQKQGEAKQVTIAESMCLSHVFGLPLARQVAPQLSI